MVEISSSVLVLTVVAFAGILYSARFGKDDSTTCTCVNDKARLAINKEMVMSFFQAATGDHDFDVIDKYLPENFIQHNPWTTDGRDTLKAAFTKILGPLPKTKVDFRRSCSEGDLVWMHHKSLWQGEEAAFVDIYRVEDGKIVEHWDVIQQFPKSTQNPHPLF